LRRSGFHAVSGELFHGKRELSTINRVLVICESCLPAILNCMAGRCEGSDIVPRTRSTVSRLRTMAVATLMLGVLVGATACGLFVKPPTVATPPAATQPPSQPPTQPPVARPPENPQASSVVTQGKPAPPFQLQALNSTSTVRFPDAFKGKVVALEFFSTS